MDECLVKLLRPACLFVACVILVAGLWPFRAPKNEVDWLPNGNGLLFGKYGSIVSAGALKTKESKEAAPCSLEIWLQPSLDYSGTILAFYWPDKLAVPLELWQSHSDLGIQRMSRGEFKHTIRTKIYVGGLFRHAKSVFLTISSGRAGTAIYADGALIKKATNFKLSSQDLTGQLVAGNAPTGTDTWSGQLKGLGVYDHELTAEEVSDHYAYWTRDRQTDLAKSEGVVALYLFNEGKGSFVNNHVDSATGLLIPERFFVLHERLLAPAWREFFPTWIYWRNGGINIAGFIPLGLFFYAYFYMEQRIKHPAVVTIVFGFALSLTIEILQAFLPTRDSGTTDLITNTFGTVLGVILSAWVMKHNWFT